MIEPSYGGSVVCSDLAKAKAYAYLICAEAPRTVAPWEVARVYDGDKGKEIYTVWRYEDRVVNKSNLVAESNGTKKKLSMIIPDKYRDMGIFDTWPYAYRYAETGKKPTKMPGTQYEILAIYYAIRDIRRGK